MNKNFIRRSIFLLYAIFLSAIFIYPFWVFADDATSTNFIIRDLIETGGGDYGTTTNFQLFDALAQPAPGRSTSSAFEIRSGFLDFSSDDSSSGSASPPPSSSSGGGSGGTSPLSQITVVINSGEVVTNSPAVVLSFSAPPEVVTAEISNFPDFRDSMSVPYSETLSWNLCSSTGSTCGEGNYTVYARFYNSFGQISITAFDSIELKYPAAVSQPSGFLGSLGEFLEPLIPGFLKPKPPEAAAPGFEAPGETVISGESKAPDFIGTSKEKRGNFTAVAVIGFTLASILAVSVLFIISQRKIK